MKFVALFSPPRSGSSWLGQIFNSSPDVAYKFQPNFAYSFNLNLNHSSRKQDIDLFIKELLETKDPFVNAEVSISGKNNFQFSKTNNLKTLIFKETHYQYLSKILLENSEGKVVGLIRNPFSTINSWLRTPKEFNSKWDVKTEWKDAALKNEDKDYTYFGYNKWKEVAFLFLDLQKKYPDRFYLLSYEDLLNNKVQETKKLFLFSDLEFTSQTLDFLESSSTKNEEDAYSVFKVKNKDDQWKKQLPEFIINEIKNDKEFVQLNKIFGWI